MFHMTLTLKTCIWFDHLVLLCVCHLFLLYTVFHWTVGSSPSPKTSWMQSQACKHWPISCSHKINFSFSKFYSEQINRRDRLSVCLSVCLRVLPLPAKSHYQWSDSFHIYYFDTVPASVTRIHRVLIILTLTFIQGQLQILKITKHVHTF